jgi:hypothetical protein
VCSGTHLSTEGGADWRRRVRLARFDGELDVSRDLRGFARHGHDAPRPGFAAAGRDARAEFLPMKVDAATRGESACEMRLDRHRRARRARNSGALHPDGHHARHSHAHSGHCFKHERRNARVSTGRRVGTSGANRPGAWIKSLFWPRLFRNAQEKLITTTTRSV